MLGSFLQADLPLKVAPWNRTYFRFTYCTIEDCRVACNKIAGELYACLRCSKPGTHETDKLMICTTGHFAVHALLQDYLVALVYSPCLVVRLSQWPRVFRSFRPMQYTGVSMLPSSSAGLCNDGPHPRLRPAAHCQRCVGLRGLTSLHCFLGDRRSGRCVGRGRRVQVGSFAYYLTKPWQTMT